MDIYRFINSKDIRTYLEKQRHTFNSLETAWLIYQCRTATLAEKHSAWNELIQTMPDCEMPERMNCVYRSSLHLFLTEYMEFQNKCIAEFYSSDDNAIYSYKVYYKEDGVWGAWGADNIYSSFEKCFSYLKSEHGNADEYSVMKRYTDIANQYLEVSMKSDGTIMTVIPHNLSDEKEDELYFQSFDGLWFDFSVPFKAGDIIWDPSHPEGYCGGPFVMTGICTADLPADRKQNIEEHGDNSDMDVWGYFVSDRGIYHECTFNYMDCEFYTEPFAGLQKVLPTLQKYLRGDENLEQLLKEYSLHLFKTFF